MAKWEEQAQLIGRRSPTDVPQGLIGIAAGPGAAVALLKRGNGQALLPYGATQQSQREVRQGSSPGAWWATRP